MAISTNKSCFSDSLKKRIIEDVSMLLAAAFCEIRTLARGGEKSQPEKMTLVQIELIADLLHNVPTALAEEDWVWLRSEIAAAQAICSLGESPGKLDKIFSVVEESLAAVSSH